MPRLCPGLGCRLNTYSASSWNRLCTQFASAEKGFSPTPSRNFNFTSNRIKPRINDKLIPADPHAELNSRKDQEEVRSQNAPSTLHRSRNKPTFRRRQNRGVGGWVGIHPKELKAQIKQRRWHTWVRFAPRTPIPTQQRKTKVTKTEN